MERRNPPALDPPRKEPGSRSRASWLRLLGAAGLLGLLALWWLLRSGPSLSVSAIGCAVLRADLACVPDRGPRLRLWIRTDPAASLTFLRSPFRRLSVHPLESDEGRLFELDEAVRESRLVILARKGFGFTVRTVRLVELMEPPWLAEAWSVRDDSPLHGARRASEFLRSRKDEAAQLAGEARARYLSLVARLAVEQNDPRAEALLEEAIAASREAGLLSEQLEAVLWLAERLGPRGHLAQAEQLLGRHQADFARAVEWGPWESKQQALQRALRGDLQTAIELVRQGRRFANRTGNWTSLYDLNTFGSELFARLGRVSQAASWLTEFDQPGATSPDGQHACRRIELIFAQAELWLLARESEPARSLPGGLRDPTELLQQALTLTQTCDQAKQRSTALTYLGRVALQRGESFAARRWIEHARSPLPNGDRTLRPYWLQVLGESALRQRDYQGAKKHFLALRGVARDQGLSAFEWSSLIGLAQVAESEPDSGAEARSLYQEAEQLLDRECLTTPLGLGRGGYLGRYQRGTALYLELLIRQGRDTEALRVLRRARVRGIRSLAALAKLPQILARAPKEYEAAMADFQRTRAALDRVVDELVWSPGDREAWLRAEKERLGEEALRALAQVLRVGGGAGAEDAGPPRDPDRTEALLACHPGRGRWICLCADASGVAHSFVDSADLEINGSQERLAAVLLLPFKEQIGRAEQLTVIAYGALRDLDVPLLPFGPAGLPLGVQRGVVYGLDLPGVHPAAASRPGPRTALAVLDPEGHFPVIRDTAEPLRGALGALGYGVLIRGAADRASLGSEKLLPELARVALFHVASHATFSKTDGWHHALRLSDDAGLMLSDILTLGSVPRHVGLFTCDSGRTHEEWGSVEGMGLAQAFLANGSEWAVGTARPVTPQMSATLSLALYRALSKDASPAAVARALTVAETAAGPLPATTRSRSEATDIGAFRVYVP